MFRLLWLIVIGALAGWIAGLLVRGRGFGIGVDIIVGILGSILGGWLLFDVLGLYGMAALGGLVARLVAAIIGALLLIVIIKALRKI
ncbi:MAG: GlsB/YeaQ/YmgE family stress response membrane protein [Candidatus Acidiferrales bacterium]